MADHINDQIEEVIPEPEINEDLVRGSTYLDDEELKAAEQALAEEDEPGANGDADQPQNQTVTDPSKTPAQQPDPKATQDEPGPVPYNRFKEVNEAGRKAHEAAIYYKGRADFMEEMMQKGMLPHQAPVDGSTQQPAPQQEQPKTPQETIASARAERRDLRRKWQEGDLDDDQYEAEMDRLEDVIYSARMEEFGSSRQPEPDPVRNADLTERERTISIEQQHPAVRYVNENELSLAEQMAHLELQMEGFQHNRDDPLSRLAVRQRTAEIVSQKWGDRVPDNERPQPAPQRSGNPQPAPNGRPNVTAEDRSRKAEIANRQPPQIGDRGHANHGPDGITEEFVLTASEEDLANLPDSVLMKLEREGVA